jgi:hypothetical protein
MGSSAIVNGINPAHNASSAALDCHIVNAHFDQSPNQVAKHGRPSTIDRAITKK